jgi:hypothetical protein
MQDLKGFIENTAKLIRDAHRQIPGPEFLKEYALLVDQLFPGGYAVAFEKIQEGDAQAVEFGLVFAEVQPYFFRSQYIRTRLIRMLKHTKLSSSQTGRLNRILEVEHDKKIKRRLIA